MPLTAAFSFRLNEPILENTACVGLYDGKRPTLTAATTGGKIFMFDPYARADEGQGDARPGARLRYLNINKKVTAVAAGALGAEGTDGRDILFVGTGTDVLAYDVLKNTDVFFRDAPEGASALRRGAARVAPSADARSEEPSRALLLVGGNCSLQGLDASGEEVFWTVASDVVTATGVFADGKMAVGTEDGGARVCSVAADGSERVAFEVREADAVTHLVPAVTGDEANEKTTKTSREEENAHLFAFASRDGAVGARDGANVAWREKRGASKRATCAVAFDLTGDGSNEIVFGFADGTMEVRRFRTGEVLFEDAFDAPLAAVLAAPRRADAAENAEKASEDLLACAADGEVRGYRAKKKGSGEGAVAPASGSSRSGLEPSAGGVSEPSVTASGRAYGFDGADADEAPAAPTGKQTEKKKKPSKLGSLLGLKKLSISEGDRDGRVASASGVPDSPLRASAAVSRETLESLNKRKQALLVELASYEKSSAALGRAERGEEGGTAVAGLIPPDTAVVSALEIDASLGHGQLILSTNNDTVVKGVVLRGEGAFEGPEESRYFRFDEKNARGEARVPILPPGDDACDVAVSVLVAASGASTTYHVFDLEFRVPRFWGWVPLRVDQVTRDDVPSGSVSFAAAEGSVRVARWLDETFRCDVARLVRDDASDVRCAFLCLADGARVVFERRAESGTASVFADTMERAGTFVDAMCVGLGIQNLDSEADFPIEMEALRETLRVVDERNARRSKLAAETADASNAVKALIVRAEDSRILRDMPAAIAAYGDLFDVNRELMVEHSKRAENHAELLKALKHVNQVIHRASRLRYGAGAARVVKACRKAVKENNTQALFRIVGFGAADNTCGLVSRSRST